MTSPHVILVGAGGHARVLLETLHLVGASVVGYVAPTTEGSRLGAIPYLGTDAYLETVDPSDVHLVNGLGSVRAAEARKNLFVSLSRLGFTFATVIDPRAQLSPSATVDQGAQVLVGAIVGVGARVEANSIVNSGAIVDHDTFIGAHAHVSPGVVLAGDVRIGEAAHIGLGARVIQGIHVGDGATVGAGAVVLADVAPGATVVGVPAR